MKFSAGGQLPPKQTIESAESETRTGELSTSDAPITGKTRREKLSIRGHAAYLILFNEWRSSNSGRGALVFEPEPAKVSAAIEAVTRYVLEDINARWAKKQGGRP